MIANGRVYCIGLLLTGVLAWAAREAVPSFSPDAYLAHIKFLASPELKGRGTGSPGLEKAAKYISAQFQSFGLKPVEGKSFYQDFTVTTNARLGPNNVLAENGHKLAPEREFIPFNFSSTGTAEGPVVFAGYGITAKEYNYDDYAGIDAKDKFVVILRHEPQEFDDKSVFEGRSFTSHAQFASKASNAKMHGARGVILINDTPNHPGDGDTFEKFGRAVGPDNAGLLFIQMSAAEGERWLAASGHDLKQMMQAIDKDLHPQSFALPEPAKVRLDVDIRRDTATVHNIAAYLPGETDEYIVVGAHYDHLGLGEKDSLAPNEIGKPHPGADDNASGTAAVIELARWFSTQPKQKRGILFMTFAGEELGLLGSAFYVNHPELPLDHAVAMINMDMVGRMRNSKIFVSGVGTGSTFQKLVDEVAPKHPITVDVSEKAGYGASDHTSFTSKQVPVLFFFSGLHADYHKPSDTWDKIDAPGSVKLLGLVADITVHLVNEEARPKFVRVADPAPPSGSGGGSGYGAYFGSIPDFTEIPNGVRFADVKDGSPAAKAGLKAGDILMEFDGKPISNLYDFTYALRSKKAGDEVLVKIVRDGKTIEAKVLLAQRK
jgi:hypothetical protein